MSSCFSSTARLALLLLLLILSGTASAQRLVRDGGLYYPTPSGKENLRGNNWLATHKHQYFDSYYHLGTDYSVDMKKGSPAYAISGGTVIYTTRNASAENSLVVIEVKVNSDTGQGKTAYAYYGHVSPRVNKGDDVFAGQLIGSVMSYPGGGDHLHFAINEVSPVVSTSVLGMTYRRGDSKIGKLKASIGWGRGKVLDGLPPDWFTFEAENKGRLEKRGFIDPMSFLNNHRPAAGKDEAILLRYRSNTNGDYFYTTDVNELGANGNGDYVRESDQGKVFLFQVPGTVRVYRYVGRLTGFHHYTTNFSELGNGNDEYVLETNRFYAFEKDPSSGQTGPSQYAKMHRYCNKESGVHLFTLDFSELRHGNSVWRYEGVAWYQKRS